MAGVLPRGFRVVVWPVQVEALLHVLDFLEFEEAIVLDINQSIDELNRTRAVLRTPRRS